ncbi:MAG TPA: hypothetical protein VGO48_13275 [Conexibacter sp.]|jgi:hypothetical protein|nr:hypothetical protein [Conexibacter sp.]
MPRRASPLATAVVLVLLALSGCGDDSLTARQLHDQATAICERTAAATDRVVVPSTPSQGGRFLQQGLAHLRPAVAQLRALKAPEDLRERYDRAVQLAGQEAALIARHERTIARGDDVIDTYRQLEAALEPLVMQENAYWRGLQVPACVRR